MQRKRVQAGSVILMLSLGLVVLGAALNASAVLSDANAAQARDKGAKVLVAMAPPAEGCEGKWDMTNSHRSLVCVDGVWQHVDFEHWVCQKPNKVVEHQHRSRTQDACEAH